MLALLAGVPTVVAISSLMCLLCGDVTSGAGGNSVGQSCRLMRRLRQFFGGQVRLVGYHVIMRVSGFAARANDGVLW